MATENSVYVVMCASCTVNSSTGEKLRPGEVSVLDPGVFRSEEEAQYKVKKLAEMGMPAWYCKSSIGAFSKIQMEEGK